MTRDIGQRLDEVRQLAKRPAFLIGQDCYLCLLNPTRKDRAGTPYTRQKNRRLV